MKQKLACLVFVLLFLLAACTPADKALRPGQLVLKPGERASSANGAVSITFVEVAQDSRCPSDVDCVWAGKVQVLIEVHQGTELQQYTLTLPPLEADISVMTLADYTIELKDVQPYPVSTDPIDSADYEITLEVSA